MNGSPTTGQPVFYLGAHQPHWLWNTNVPLFVSHRQLARKAKLRPSTCRKALDSGGFTELSLHGRWVTTPAEYADAAQRYTEECGPFDFMSQQDSMCEPFMIQLTGLSVHAHLDLTVANFLDLVALAPHLPWLPVLQGWTLANYLRCFALFLSAGIDLRKFPRVGIGSVCRRQSTRAIAEIVTELSNLGLRLHGFGVKTGGLPLYGHRLASADSMAWSYAARREPPLPGCTHLNCANCLRYALAWRTRLLTRQAARGHQTDLFNLTNQEAT